MWGVTVQSARLLWTTPLPSVCCGLLLPSVRMMFLYGLTSNRCRDRLSLIVTPPPPRIHKPALTSRP